mmetsp:Transcript_13299/g.28738  ORF Transcript_13299/g.28738 Transcript_13299/m.28738 type:complete len:85 (-) Transcript_13299:300-554(-)
MGSLGRTHAAGLARMHRQTALSGSSALDCCAANSRGASRGAALHALDLLTTKRVRFLEVLKDVAPRLARHRPQPEWCGYPRMAA